MMREKIPRNRTPARAKRRAGRSGESVLYNVRRRASGIWLWSVANSTIVPDWESWSFDRRAQGATPTVLDYVASRSKDVEEDVEIWLQLRPPRPAKVISAANEPL